MRKIVIMIGSDSDLPQCKAGLQYLEGAQGEGKVKVVKVITNSIHRNTILTQGNLRDLSGEIDVLVAGAGMANHLTGTADAFLRNQLNDKRVVVVGVAFHGKIPEHTRAARESIIYVPGTQVVFDEYVGEEGFLRACQFAVEGDLPKIELGAGKPAVIRTLEGAIIETEKRINEKKNKEVKK